MGCVLRDTTLEFIDWKGQITYNENSFYDRRSVDNGRMYGDKGVEHF